MSVAIEKCASCGALVDVEDLFCANCGREVPDAQGGRTERVATEARNFQCRGCGATMNYDASAKSLKCPFCGSVDLAEDGSRGVLAPELVIPFAIDRADAEGRLRSWLGSSFWHPNDLRNASRMTELRAVYLPFWVFATDVETHWTADSGRTPPGARAAWYPVYGSWRRRYEGIWAPASAGLPRGELAEILPFDAAAGVPPDRVDLVDVTVEQFAVARRYARPAAQETIEALEAEAVTHQVPEGARNVHVNALMEGAESRPALAPVYIMAYRYGEKVYRYVLNGQTGKATGTAPLSWRKIAQIVGIILIILVLILLFSALFNR